MGFLKNSKCYLSGAIEGDSSGVNWREEPKQILAERWGIDVFDPFADPKQKKYADLELAKRNRDWKRLEEIACDFVAKDLGVIDRSDFLIARIGYQYGYLVDDLKDFKVEVTGVHGHYQIQTKQPRLMQIPTTGTVHEIINSDLYKKPTLLICEQGLEYIPTWYRGIIRCEFMFDSWDKLYEYLQEVDDGKHANNPRWRFVCGTI